MIPYEDYIGRDMFRPKLVYLKKKTLCDNIFCFDIETCNFFVSDQGEVLSINDIFERSGYNATKAQHYFDTYEPGATCFIWQCCIDGTCIYGRYLPDFRKLCDYLSERTDGARLHCWIHNLAFEYQFIQEYFSFDKENIFFTEARKPLYAEYNNITFRCSYRLTNLSLAKWGKNNGIEKKDGLDYHGLYTPLTDLTAEQLDYCEYDVIIMWKGLQKYLKDYTHVEYIPLTQTGMPRKDIKSLNQKNKGTLYRVAACQPKTPEEWKIQRTTYAGGLTLCNPAYVGMVLEGVEGFDKKSAYPFALLEKYPSSGFEKVYSSSIPNWKDGYHHICLMEFREFRAKYNITPQSASKRVMMEGAELCPESFHNKDIKKNNGKVRYAKRFALYVTEMDMQLISLYYTWEKIIIHSHWIASSDYLPKHVIEYMLDKYAAKTLLTGIDETMRARSKEILNAIYGMCGTSLIHDTIVELPDFRYKKTRPTDIDTQLQLFALQEKKYKNVLPYSVGIYCTSYQRYFLMKFAHDLGIDKSVYFDTDSDKGLFDERDFAFVRRENQRIIEWTKERCEAQGIKYEKTCPMNTLGYREYLGIWEHDSSYHEFKCLRAKCYAYKTKPDDHVHITIAGVPKAAANALHEVDDLKEGLTFDIFNSRKNLLTYRDGDNPQVTFPDGYKVTNVCAVNIRPTSYKLSLEGEYRELIKTYLAQKYH